MAVPGVDSDVYDLKVWTYTLRQLKANLFNSSAIYKHNSKASISRLVSVWILWTQCPQLIKSVTTLKTQRCELVV